MPPIPRRARFYLKTAIVFLVLGVLTGLHMSSAKHLEAGGMHWPYVVAHTHLILIGFFLQGAMGCAIWLLPSAPPGSRYRPAVDVGVYLVLALGTVTRFTLEVSLGYHESRAADVAVFAVSCLQALAMFLFFWNVWPRIRGPLADG